MTIPYEQGFFVEENFPDHHFRIEIPNIVDDLNLTPTQYRIYCKLKRIAGDSGICWQSQKNLAEQCGISERTLISTLPTLSVAFKQLGGLPLIKITHRKKEDGSKDTSVISITNIWPVNGEVYREKAKQKKKEGSAKMVGGGGAKSAPGVVQNLHQGGAKSADKEEQRRKNRDEEGLYKDRDITESEEIAVVPALSLSSSKEEKKEKGQPRKGKVDWASKLPKEEKDFHDVVTSYTAPNGQVLDSDFITAQLRTHGLKKCEQAFEYCLYTINRTGIKSTFGGMFRNSLKGEYKVPDENFQKNRKLAEFAKEKCKKFNVTQKYVSLPEMSWDLPYSIPHEAFKAELHKKFKYMMGQ